MQEFQTMVVKKKQNLEICKRNHYKKLYTCSIFGNYSKAQCGSNVWEKMFYVDSLHVKRLIIENIKWPGLVYK